MGRPRAFDNDGSRLGAAFGADESGRTTLKITGTGASPSRRVAQCRCVTASIDLFDGIPHLAFHLLDALGFSQNDKYARCLFTKLFL
ncbi:hypothetical protein, partial [Bordetella bronchiseptica]|uniref:hypothetical protein n=1 Tax=Bordetella bronchiseptica TaxID=518 RepID=UPI001F44717D